MLAMETAFCGKSLRSSTLFLLYMNLIGNTACIFVLVSAYGIPLYTLDDTDDIIDFFTVFSIKVIQNLIFWFTISSVNKEKKSTSLLTTVIVFLLMEVFYEICDGFRRIVEFKNVAQNCSKSRCQDRVQRLIIIDVFLIAYLIYKIYSVLVIHNYKRELKQKLVNDAPPTYDAQFLPPQYTTDLPPYKAGPA